MESAVSLSAVRKDYGGFVLKDVSFDIPRGYVTGIIGNNGAGKSTLIKCIGGAVNADSGSIVLNAGLDKSGIGYVFDECPYPQYFDCEHLSRMFGMMFGSWDESKYYAYLSEFGIDRKKKVKDLSRGMGMKLQVAVCFSHATQMLILDEPTAGMDPASRDEFLDILREYMRDETHTVFMSSHITGDLERIADFIVFVKDGEKVLEGEKDVILESYGLLKSGNGACPLEKEHIVCSRHGEFGTDYLVRDKHGIREAYPELVVDDVSLENLMVMFCRGQSE